MDNSVIIAGLSVLSFIEAIVIVIGWKAILNLEENQRSMVKWITNVTNIIEGHEGDISRLQGQKVVKFPARH